MSASIVYGPCAGGVNATSYGLPQPSASGIAAPPSGVTVMLIQCTVMLARKLSCVRSCSTEPSAGVTETKVAGGGGGGGGGSTCEMEPSEPEPEPPEPDPEPPPSETDVGANAEARLPATALTAE